MFYVDKLPELTPDDREVESIIHFDIYDLLNPENLKSEDMQFADGFTRKNIRFLPASVVANWETYGRSSTDKIASLIKRSNCVSLYILHYYWLENNKNCFSTENQIQI